MKILRKIGQACVDHKAAVQSSIVLMASDSREENHALLVIRAHANFFHRYHVVSATKYRYKVLQGATRERIREIVIQTCDELGVHIVLTKTDSLRST